MTATTSKIEAVPTNIITGFLGAGKTTAILHLLKSKPENERWAVLVNEFGEIGIDGSLFSGQHNENSGVFVGNVNGVSFASAGQHANFNHRSSIFRNKNFDYMNYNDRIVNFK